MKLQLRDPFVANGLLVAGTLCRHSPAPEQAAGTLAFLFRITSKFTVMPGELQEPD